MRTSLFQMKVSVIFQAGFLVLTFGSFSLSALPLAARNQFKTNTSWVIESTDARIGSQRFSQQQQESQIFTVLGRETGNRKAPESSNQKQARFGFKTKVKDIVNAFVRNNARSGSDYDSEDYYYDDDVTDYDEQNDDNEYKYDEYDPGNGVQYQDDSDYEYPKDDSMYDDDPNNRENDYDYSNDYIETNNDYTQLINETFHADNATKVGSEIITRRKRKAPKSKGKNKKGKGKKKGKSKKKRKGRGKGKGKGKTKKKKSKGNGNVNCKKIKNRNKPFCINKRITNINKRNIKKFNASKKKLDQVVKDVQKSKRYINSRITKVNTTLINTGGKGLGINLTETITSLNKTLMDTAQVNMDLKKSMVATGLVLANITDRIVNEEVHSKAIQIDMIKLTGFVNKLAKYIQVLFDENKLNQTIASTSLSTLNATSPSVSTNLAKITSSTMSTLNSTHLSTSSTKS